MWTDSPRHITPSSRIFNLDYVGTHHCQEERPEWTRTVLLDCENTNIAQRWFDHASSGKVMNMDIRINIDSILQTIQDV